MSNTYLLFEAVNEKSYLHKNLLVMLSLDPNYVTDKRNKKVAVQLSIKTYEKIEEIFENYALYHLMETARTKKALDRDEAKAYYAELKKKK